MRCLAPAVRRAVLTPLVLVLLLPAGGCIGMLAQGMYLITGHLQPAAFTDLEGQRVAVVCMSESSSPADEDVATTLARQLQVILQRNVTDIDVVPHEEVTDWIGSEWNEIDYREIGRGVQADMVVAVDLAGFRVREGQTLYRGRCDMTVTVYDMSQQEGRVVFRRSKPDFAFPINGVQGTTDISEAQFRHSFVRAMARHVSRYFYAYDVLDDFAPDHAELGR